ncbi:MAG: L,D-transpeptidase family protein [Verrucomicrobiota bacterium]
MMRSFIITITIALLSLTSCSKKSEDLAAEMEAKKDVVDASVEPSTHEINTDTPTFTPTPILTAQPAPSPEITPEEQVPLDAEVALPVPPPMSPLELAFRDYFQKTLPSLASTAGAKYVTDFYILNHYELAWDLEGEKSTLADGLLQAIEESYLHGMNPEDYQAELLRESLDAFFAMASHERTVEQKAAMDATLTRIFQRLANHYYSGRINPSLLGQRWNRNKQPLYTGTLLYKTLPKNSADAIRDAILVQAPQRKAYSALMDKLAYYRRLAQQGEWSPVAGSLSDDWKVEPGEKYAGTPQLKQRLAFTGEFTGETNQSTRYSGAIVEAVKAFQENHSLEVDGILGKNTLRELNIPLQQRMEQVMVNLERQRWMPRDFGDRYVIVNIPEYTLRAYDDDVQKERMRIVVGNAERRTTTPVINNVMKYVVFRPFWNVPYSIANGELLPLAESDPNYLDSNNYEIVSSGNIIPNDIKGIDLVKSRKAYLRQKSGSFNALGHVKFLFPNEHAVYMHDTNQTHLFGRTRRDFSHGCVRLHRPADMAAYVLGNQGWSKQGIEEKMYGDTRKSITLKKYIEVYFYYMTAFYADEKGAFRFCEDIYDHDSRLANMLKKPSPTKIAFHH